jgi:hypothetical protein
MPICREDVDRQWENILFTTRWSIDRRRFHNRSLDFPAAIEVAIKNSRVSAPCVTSLLPTSGYFQ